MELIYTLVNESNVKLLVRELLNFLVVSDVRFRQDVVAKLCWVTEKYVLEEQLGLVLTCFFRYAPNKRWHFDTILKVVAVVLIFSSLRCVKIISL